jgi:polysaccharide pyruvyl transferase WcaK-like protein
MRFLVESGTYQIDNVGDISMLQRTVRRLGLAFPSARIAVVTERPDRLAEVLPEVEPVRASPWFRLRTVPVPRRWEYAPLVRGLRWREPTWAGVLPRVSRLGKRFDFHATRGERAAADAFYAQVHAADAVVAAGGGYVNDFYHEHAWKVLATMSLAQGLGRPTAMFGAGLGPITRHDLKWRARRILPRLHLLALREAELGPREAAGLGVGDARIVVTGDDAIPIALEQPVLPIEHRAGLGVNLRLSADAEVPGTALAVVRVAVARAADRLAATIVPLVIRTHRSPVNDITSAIRIFGDAIDLSAARRVLTPQDALAEVARCRVVVTGAYHNAVFALAMGIPVVGLGQSAYYASKLHGLAAQFGGGMRVLTLDDPDLPRRLEQQIVHSWETADDLAGPLQNAARRQTEAGEAAYARFLRSLRPARRAGGR